MSSAFEVPPSPTEPQDRPDLVEIHNCVQATLANLDVEGVEFFIELDQEILKITLQTKKFLEAQDLAVDLGQKIEQIAAADIVGLAIYKRKSADASAFLIKEMSLGKPEILVDQADHSDSSDSSDSSKNLAPIANSPRSVSDSSTSQFKVEYRPRLDTGGVFQSYQLRSISALLALVIGGFGVYGISRIFDSFEQKPLTYIDVKQLPGLGTIKNDPEVMVYQVAFPRATNVSRFLVFLPTQPAKPKLPCIFVAPSATAPLYGQTIDEETVVYWHYINYVKAGYAVIAYDVDGYIDQIGRINETSLVTQPDKVVINSLKAYKASDAGVLNAKLAIDYAVARLPQIDPDAMYTAGSGAGGTLSLMVAATDKRIKAAIAYSPTTDVPKQYGSLVETISKAVPGYKEFIDRSSPHHNIEKMNKPILIFHDDRLTETSLEDTTNFVALVKKNNPLISLTHDQDKEFPNGDGMTSTSITQAIEWLNTQQKK
jgi:dienelactone hydrolase